MTDPTTFEARLVASLDRYAERMPVGVDARQLTRDLAGVQGDPGDRRRWGISWPTVRLVLLVGLVLALVAASLLIAGRALRESRPSPINGRIMVTAHGDPHRLYMLSMDGSSTLVEVGSPWACPHLLPGGETIAYWTAGGGLDVVGFDGAPPRELARTALHDDVALGESLAGEVWTSDDSRVAVATDGILIVDAVRSTTRRIPVDDVVAMEWSPNGSLTIARQRQDEVELSTVGPDDVIGPAIVRFAWDTETLGSPRFAWSPTGTHLAFIANAAATLEILDPIDGKRSTIPLERDVMTEPATIFSPDGRRIAVSTEGRFVIMDPDGSDPVAFAPIDSDPSSLLGWSPDGSWIALGAGGAHVAIHPDGTGMVRLVSRLSRTAAGRFGGAPSAIRWAPDSSMLAFTNEGYGTHSVSTFPVDGSFGATLADFEADGGGINCFDWPAAAEGR